MIRLILALPFLLPQQDNVAQWVRALEEDAIGIRDQAMRDLIAAGEKARPEVERAMRQTTNVEALGRLREVLRRLDVDKRRAAFGGGKIVNDVGLKLSAAYRKDERKLEVTVEITNFGTTERVVVPLRRWDTRLPNHSSSGSGSEGCIVVNQLTEREWTGEYSSSFG
jgi:hypothetical protein